MTTPSSDHDYWEDRARRHGRRAAGYRDLAMNEYEDRLRRSAVERLLGQGGGRRLLDAGCGTGLWSVRLAGAGWQVTGVDLSEALITLATAAPNVTYIAGAMEDIDLPAASFDAWMSVTALQHITVDADFSAGLNNLTRMLRPGGFAAVLEYAPLAVLGHTPAYMRARSRRQWIEALTTRGYVKAAETGVRFIGHGPYMLAVRLFRRFGKEPAALRLLRSAGWALDLSLARTPLVTQAGDVRLLLFEKRA